jgi:hypothetical protein
VFAALQRDEFGGDANLAFVAFDADADKALDAGEVERALLHCGVGNEWTIGKWVARVMDELDADRDGRVSVSELHARFPFRLSYKALECNDPQCVARSGRPLQAEKDLEAARRGATVPTGAGGGGRGGGGEL